MRRFGAIALGCCALWSMGCGPEIHQETIPVAWADPYASANPFVGTGGHGHTFPGATVPFGMVQLSPDTRLEGWDGCSGYHDSDSVVYGFSHTHLSGTGVSDYGDVLLMPLVGEPHLENGAKAGVDQGYASRFDKESEMATAGYYRVHLKDYDIQVELSATERCGLHRYSFPETDTGYVVVDLRHRDPLLDVGLEVVGPREVEGFRISRAWAQEQHLYFVARFSHNFAAHHLEGEGKSDRGWLAFARPGVVEVEVGISAVDLQGARQNLDARPRAGKFAGIAEDLWKGQLGKVQVKGGSPRQQSIFYAALYHTAIAPNLFVDVDGRYRGMDQQIHQVPAGDRHYTVFSLWDTFRAAHPWYTLTERKRTGEFVRTFLRQYREGGLLPVWELAANETNCMIGYHAVPVIAEAYFGGVRDFDAQEALEAMVASAETDLFGLPFYREKGFIGAADEAESVSRTLEYAYDDWCISEMARSLGEEALADRFRDRAAAYRNLYDPQTGFFRARMNGGWQPGFDPREVNFNFTEANAWQYSGFVPQDITGWADLLGGPAALERHLDSLFAAQSQTTGRDQADITGLIGQYAHGNEPSHHMAYLYAFAGAPDKGADRLRQIMDELYSDQPDGLSGNEDCGQMSAWYVFSALGFYPVTPGSGTLVLGSPLFPEARIQLENGKEFVIQAPATSPTHKYIQGVRLNGQALDRLYLRYDEVLAGGVLKLDMGDTPGTKWWKETPRQSLAGPRPLAAPVLHASGQTFADTLRLRVESIDREASLEYRFREGDWQAVPEGGLVLEKSAEVAVRSRLGEQASPVVKGEFFLNDDRRSIDLRSAYANQYAAGGEKALIDQLRGGANFRTGRWQGFREDLEAVVDLGEVKRVEAVYLGCLQDIKSWIWMPQRVVVSTSRDGKNWQPGLEVESGVPEDHYGALIRDVGGPLAGGTEARFIRVQASQLGECPAWHLGAGGKTWIFADEILIR